MFMLPMMLGMGMMSFFYIGRGGGSSMTIIFGVMYLSLMVGMMVMMLARGGASKKAEINRERRDYLRYLANVRKDVHDVSRAQRGHLLFGFPEPVALGPVVAGPRLWERRRGDPDAFHVRVARGPQRLATPLRSPQTVPLEDLDPVASTSLRHFVRTYASVPDLPVAIALRGFAQIVVTGERPAALDAVRAWVAGLTAFHSPDDLRIAVMAAEDRLEEWTWLKWLPHAQHPTQVDETGPLVQLCSSSSALDALLHPVLTDRPRFTADPGAGVDVPQVVVLVDDPGAGPGGVCLAEGGLYGVTVVDVAGAWPGKPDELRLVVEADRMGIVRKEGVEYVGVPDRLDETTAADLARRLAPIRLPSAAEGDSTLTTHVGLPELLGIGDPRSLDVVTTWRPRSRRDRLRIPFGLDPSGLPVELDFKESAEGGMGPHGLVIGATGSGKSELLRTLVTGLAATHSSEMLNFALVDFKGGATFAGLAALPHTCAVITNLEDDLALVDRMREALHGELIRRQELLKRAGNFASARDYERAREAGAELAPLPTLMVIIDEFSELLSSKPDFIEVFVMIGRLGRSLGVHLMLASQRLDEGRLRGLDSHLSYRIGLRTFSASESRSVLGVPDAYELPSVPGSGYLKTDTSTMLRFKAAFVSGALPAVADLARPRPTAAPQVLLFEPGAAAPPAPRPTAATPAEEEPEVVLETTAVGESMMDAMIRRITGHGPPPHPVWLPPLDESPSLDRLLPPLVHDQERGLCPAGWPALGRLMVPVGVVDKPFEQLRDLLWVNLTGSAGHTVVVGGPHSGKSTAARSLVLSLALTHTPSEVQVFGLDFGGGGLSALAGLPHVAGIADRQDEERCRRIVATLTALLDEREAAFREQGIDSMEAFRRRRAANGETFGYGDVFLVVDNWLTLKQDFEQLEDAIVMLANRGLSFGIHLLVTASRWWDIRMQTRDLFGTRIELRLGDPADSEIDRTAAVNVPANTPGRGLTAERRHCLVALPRVDGRSTTGDLSEGVASTVAAIAAAATGAAPELGLLPTSFPLDRLPTDGLPFALPLGLGESRLGPVSVDLAADPHLVVFGDVESGKTNVVRVLFRQLVSRFEPDQVRILVVDYRRNLVDLADDDHVLAYCGSEQVLREAVAGAVAAVTARLPGLDVTAEQLRTKSWWAGPHLVVLVDDYDLVGQSAQNPLAPLVDLLGQARDIGLHVVVTRRSGGAGRAIYDPVLGRLRELSSPGLVLSGNREEGPLVGEVKPERLPPGRGWLVRRREGVELVQVAWAGTAED